MQNQTNVFIMRNTRFYKGSFKIASLKFPCFTKSQFKKLIVNKNRNYDIIGEVSNDNSVAESAFSTLLINNIPYKISRYKSFSRFSYKLKGFVKCGDDDCSYVALVKKVRFMRILLIILLTLILAVSSFLAFNFITNDFKFNFNYNFNFSGQSAVSSTVASSDIDTVKVPGYKTLYIEAGQKQVEVPFNNPQENNCYFIISMIVDGQKMYESKLLSPGSSLDSITLTSALDEGTYDATLNYKLYTYDENRTFIDKADVDFKLYVEESFL